MAGVSVTVEAGVMATVRVTKKVQRVKRPKLIQTKAPISILGKKSQQFRDSSATRGSGEIIFESVLNLYYGTDRFRY